MGRPLQRRAPPAVGVGGHAEPAALEALEGGKCNTYGVCAALA